MQRGRERGWRDAERVVVRRVELQRVLHRAIVVGLDCWRAVVLMCLHSMRESGLREARRGTTARWCRGGSMRRRINEALSTATLCCVTRRVSKHTVDAAPQLCLRPPANRSDHLPTRGCLLKAPQDAKTRRNEDIIFCPSVPSIDGVAALMLTRWVDRDKPLPGGHQRVLQEDAALRGLTCARGRFIGVGGGPSVRQASRSGGLGINQI